ncbi:MAG: pyrimidine-specific ribonucleoside hydrolase RihA [Bacteroidetes bacterium]|nr:pyrimidine-specific ribonucleoside hydrolase RihA [Bacteroidota bacterium]
MRRIPIILDCDPGHDDAIAMILAHASPEIEILGVTSVAGNQTVEKTTLNALKMLTFLGLRVPVAKGCPKPLFRDLIIAPEVHGVTGLDGPDLPEPGFPIEECSAVELIARILRESERKVTLVPTGALTNIALLLIAYPELKDKIEQISLMGGAAEGGNWTPAAEFNILVDPEAADIVFKSGLPITMAGLDVTHKAIITKEDTERFRKIGTKAAGLVAELLDFFVTFHEENFPQFGGSPLHDACAVAWLIRPDLFTSVHKHVAIDTGGELTTGCTVTDMRAFLAPEPNTEVLVDVKRQEFVDFLAERFSLLD